MTDLDIFHNAPEDATPAELAVYLDEACGEDSALRARVEALFAAELAERTDDFLEGGVLSDPDDTPTLGPDGEVSPAPRRSSSLNLIQPATERAGDVIGPYILVEPLGEGGFGTVWKAEQTLPLQREVALKVIKAGMDTREVLRRFEVERQALARMDHDHIAKVLDAGETDGGRPYFVMELVDGIPITEYCDQHGLGIEGRMELFAEVCAAVNHAHQKGIIHRDLKPSNLMVTEQDERPVVKVIDFGIAKAIEGRGAGETMLTVQDQMIGTPAYMSPEQAGLGELDIDTRSDVYSLGVVLYELLAGRPPFSPKTLRAAGFDEMRRIIREQEPVRPSLRVTGSFEEDEVNLTETHGTEPQKVSKQLRGELDWIVLKALEKDRNRRYSTVSGLAEDIRSYLADEPVSAAAPSFRYQAIKLVRRHRAPIGVAAAMIFLIAAGAIVSSILAVKANKAQRDAVDARTEAEHNERVIAYHLAEEIAPRENPNLGLARLAKMLREDPSNHLIGERVMAAMIQRDFPVPVLSRFTGSYLRFSPNGDVLLVSNRGGFQQVYFIDVARKQEIGQIIRLGGNMRHAEFSPDGQLVVTCSRVSGSLYTRVEIWDWMSGRRIMEPVEFKKLAQYASFSPDGTMVLAVADGGNAKVWNVQPGNIAEDGSLVEPPTTIRRRGPVVAGAWSPDSQRFAIVANSPTYATGEIWVKEGNEFELVTEVSHAPAVEKGEAYNGILSCIAFNHDGSRFLTCGIDGSARIWDTRGGQPVGVPLWHEDKVEYAEFSSDGSLVVTASWDRTARVWDAESGAPVTDPLRLSGRVESAHFDTHGMRVIAGCRNGEVHIWNAFTGETVGAPFRREGPIVSTRFHPSRPIVAIGSVSEGQLWNVQPRNSAGLVLRHPPSERWRNGARNVHSADFRSDGKLLVTAGSHDLIHLWNTDTGQRIAGIENIGFTQRAQFHPSGSHILTTSSSAGAAIWEVPTAGIATQPLAGSWKQDIAFAEFSPASGVPVVVGAGSIPPGAWLWRLREGGEVEERALFDEERSDYASRAAGFDGDGKRVATISEDRKVRIWDVATGDLLIVLQSQFSESDAELSIAVCLDFSPKGDRLIAGYADSKAIVWDITPDTKMSDRFVCELLHRDEVPWVEFSPDGELVLTASIDGTARIWNARTGAPVGLELRHNAAVRKANFSPDGRRIVTASADETARLWDARTGFPLSDALRHNGEVRFAGFSPDGRRIVTTGNDAAIALWDLPPSPEGEVPEWVPPWVEAVLDIRVAADNSISDMGRSLRNWNQLKETVEALPDNGYYARIAKWFYRGNESRTTNPFSAMTLSEYVDACLASTSIEGAEEAVRAAPFHPKALAELAGRLRDEDGAGDPIALLRIRMLEKWAAEFSEEASEADPILQLQTKVILLERQGRSEEEMETRKKLIRLIEEAEGGGHSEVMTWKTRLADRLTTLGRDREALEYRLEVVEAQTPESYEDRGNLAHQYHLIGLKYRQLGDEEIGRILHEKALHLADQAIEEVRGHSNPHKALVGMQGKARWAVEFENWELARSIYDEMLAICLEKHPEDKSVEPLIPLVGSLRAATALKRNAGSAAWEKLARTLLDVLPAAEAGSAAYARHHVAMICVARKPGMYLPEILERTSESSGNPIRLAQGMIHFRMGEHAKAAELLDEVVNIWRPRRNLPTEKQHELVLALAYQALNAVALEQNEEARRLLAEAEGLRSKLADPLLWYKVVFIDAALAEAKQLLEVRAE